MRRYLNYPVYCSLHLFQDLSVSRHQSLFRHKHLQIAELYHKYASWLTKLGVRENVTVFISNCSRTVSFTFPSWDKAIRYTSTKSRKRFIFSIGELTSPKEARSIFTHRYIVVPWHTVALFENQIAPDLQNILLQNYSFVFCWPLSFYGDSQHQCGLKKQQLNWDIDRINYKLAVDVNLEDPQRVLWRWLIKQQFYLKVGVIVFRREGRRR